MHTSKIFVTVDIILQKNDSILLIKRKKEPFANCWAFPGGFMEEDEDIEDAAKRELEEETSIKVAHLEQVGAFGKPGRDPRNPTISIVHYAMVPENTVAIAADDAKEAQWFSIQQLPELAFDHATIIQTAITKQFLKISNSTP